MMYTSLDKITRSVLAQRSLPIHYYLKYLKHAADCFQELHYSTLRVVNTVLLPVDPDTNAATIPCDCVDFVKVGIEIGQFIRPLHFQRGINRLPNLDETGSPTKYPTISADFAFLMTPGIDFNQYGEHAGRQWGYTDKLLGDTFTWLPERNIIQLNQAITGVTELYFEYVGNGTYANACTKVDPLAKATIEDFVKWQCSPNADDKDSREGRKFTASWRMLRARKNPMTAADIRRSINGGLKSTLR